MEKHHDNLAVALDALEKGLAPIPIIEGTKIPAVKWKEWQTQLPSQELVREWFSVERNIAILTNGMVVFDCDDPEKADLVLEHCGDTSHKIRTPRGGIHLGFRLRMGVTLTNQVRILRTKKNPEGLPIDLRTFGGYELIPNSRTADGAYVHLGDGLKPVRELPYGNIAWTRTRTKKRVQSTILAEVCDPGSIVWRGRLYIDKFEHRAKGGASGHTTCFIAALKIVSFVRKLGGGEQEAWELLLYYNATKCDPPWDVTNPKQEQALRHKLEDAMKKAR